MSIDLYNQFKRRYDNTKPIRGRAVECRPWGDRKRTHEQVTKVLTPQGESYCAKLYDTDVVVVCPNGDIYLRTDGWNSYMTAEWIRYRSPFYCYKKFGRTWVSVAGREIPINSKESLHVKYNPETNSYTCDKEVKLTQKVIDRSKSKVERASVKPIKDFIRVMMKLADGWITDELKQAHRTYPEESNGWRNRYGYEVAGQYFSNWDLSSDRMWKQTAEKILAIMQNHEALEDRDKVTLMLMLAEGCNAQENRTVRIEERETEYNGKPHKWQDTILEYRYNPTAVANRVDYIVKKACDIYTEKERIITKPLANLM